MGIIEILLIAIGLSMDAFAVSIGKGLSVSKIRLSHALKVGLWFGGFQALMPLIGYFLGSTFASAIASIDHWVAFILLTIIGFNMIREAMSSGCEEIDACFSAKSMFILAVATSIDALAAGVTFSFTQVDIWQTIAIIGVTTFVFSVLGLKIGNLFGCRYKKNAEFVGGAILIIIGLKILIEHF